MRELVFIGLALVTILLEVGVKIPAVLSDCRRGEPRVASFNGLEAQPNTSVQARFLALQRLHNSWPERHKDHHNERRVTQDLSHKVATNLRDPLVSLTTDRHAEA